MFAGGAAGSGGWVGLTITYPRPLSAPIADANIIDVQAPASNAPHCPGPGHADPAGVGAPQFQSDDDTYFRKSLGKLGAELYWATADTDVYVGGEWTVTAK